MSDYKGTGTMAAGSSFPEMEHEKFARLRDENATLRADLTAARTALERIAEYETDWAKGTADNVGALQAIAEGALHLPSEPAPSAPLPRNPTWDEALLEQADREAARAKSGATPDETNGFSDPQFDACCVCVSEESCARLGRCLGRERNRDASPAPLPRNPTWNEALLEQAQREAARADPACTCGDADHPRRCNRHPGEYKRHCDALRAENGDDP